MKILFLTHSFNSLTQRLYVELSRDGHTISIEYDIHDDVTREAISLFRPDLILAPFLKRAIPQDVWEKVPCWIVHPGIPGDRGPSSLDWAILEGVQEWGVTVLQANEVMDGGDIWASATFPMREASKSSLYRQEVTEAAVRAVREALQNFQNPDFKPIPLHSILPTVKGCWRPAIRQEDRNIDWKLDDTETVLRKIRSADSSPGVWTQLLDEEVALFDVYRENELRGNPGQVIARRENAICIGTLDSAIWVTHLKKKKQGTQQEIKLPAQQVLASKLKDIPKRESSLPRIDPSLFYEENGDIGSIYFSFYRGAMSTHLCQRLQEVFEYATTRPTRTIILWGGDDFWSNGIDLCQIESSSQPAEESWRNIQAMDDLVEKILRTESHYTLAAIQGNAGAGGVFLALALDSVVLRDGVILNPHYKNMGNLYGSEFWTYSLPRRIADPEKRKAVESLRLPIGAREAQSLGLCDAVYSNDRKKFFQDVITFAQELSRDEVFFRQMELKRAQRARDEKEKSLQKYRDEELKRMRLNFFGFDPSYHVARYHFVYRIPNSKTPLHLAKHRNGIEKLENLQAKRIRIRGTVQGVGFRPFLYRWAEELGLKGTIQNQGDGVEAFLEGSPKVMDRFLKELREKAPLQAQIESLEVVPEVISHRDTLKILESTGEATDFSIPVDLSTCAKCREEYLDPLNRRYLYPFLSCTECGPRYSTVARLPYDRKNTSFSSFPLCASCQKEYGSISDRRFHAETTVCSLCGPRLQLMKLDGSVLLSSDDGKIEEEVHQRLKAGQILALKSLGGFQLVANASNREAIEILRARKKRPSQAFAVMARDLECIRGCCELSTEDEKLLQSSIAPILVLKRRELRSSDLISPDTDTLAVMLPTTPIHQMLFGAKNSTQFDFLIVTSGNAHGAPICLTDEQVMNSLGSIADVILTHDREIVRRCDDSVWVSSREGKHQIWRMGRGIAPQKWIRPHRTKKTVLALGAELKNTISIAFSDRIIVSPHIGNLFQFETYRSFQEMVENLLKLMNQTPEAITIDLHPQYSSSLFGKKLAEERGLPLLEVQHHHAHAAACMAEHGLSESLALVYDGTGYGTDGTLWGGELLYVSPQGFQRLGRLRPTQILGGDSSVVHPWKQACARLFEVGIEIAQYPELLKTLGIENQDAKLFQEIYKRKLNSWSTSSVGRLFDSVSSILGLIGNQVSYEGQAAVLLETCARRGGYPHRDRILPYSFQLNHETSDLLEVDFREMIKELVQESLDKTNPQEMACRFQKTLYLASQELIEFGVNKTGIRDVVLSGGVFQNRLLTDQLMNYFSNQSSSQKIQLHEHQNIPPNDGGVSYGQAVIASEFFRSTSSHLV